VYVLWGRSDAFVRRALLAMPCRNLLCRCRLDFLRVAHCCCHSRPIPTPPRPICPLHHYLFQFSLCPCFLSESVSLSFDGPLFARGPSTQNRPSYQPANPHCITSCLCAVSQKVRGMKRRLRGPWYESVQVGAVTPRLRFGRRCCVHAMQLWILLNCKW
jgi:hypothetical protein